MSEEINLASTYIANYIIPLCEKYNMSPEEFKPHLFAQIIKLLHQGKIDSRRVRRWIEERVGEKELEDELIKTGAANRKLLDLMDQLEINALSKNEQ